MWTDIINCLIADIGLGLASVAKSTWRSYSSYSSKIDKVKEAREIPISGLASIVSGSDSSVVNEIVVIRGLVEPLPVRLYTPRNYTRESPPLPPNFVVASNEVGERRAVLQRITLFSKLDDDENSWPSFMNNLPFVVIPSGTVNGNGSSEFVIINEDTFSHPPPLTTVYHRILESSESASHHGDIHSEEILAVGEEISVIGRFCTLQDGTYQIKACEDLPYFLTKKTKPEMLRGLVKGEYNEFCFVICCGVLSICLFAYALRKLSRYWKGSRRLQELKSNVAAEEDVVVGDDEERVCVICYVRRKTFVFVPCGHLLCCGPCALNVVKDPSQTCPLCRLPIRNIVKLHV